MTPECFVEKPLACTTAMSTVAESEAGEGCGAGWMQRAESASGLCTSVCNPHFPRQRGTKGF